MCSDRSRPPYEHPDNPSPIEIRPYEPEDAESLFEAIGESVEKAAPFAPWCRRDYSLAQARDWVAAQVESFRAGKSYEFSIRSRKTRYLGGVGLNSLDLDNRRANLGYWLRSSATGRGFAAQAVRLLVEWGFANTDLRRIEIVSSTENAPSLRTAEKAGAIREGVLRSRLFLHGRPHDAVVFSFVR